jgi:hypothetical protein
MEKCLANAYSPVFNDGKSASELQEGNSQDSLASGTRKSCAALHLDQRIAELFS